MPGSTKLVQGGCAAGRRTCAAVEGADAGGRGLAHAVLPAAFECSGILSLHTSHMKPSTCDIRLPMLAVALLPLGLWGLALVVLILQWPGPRGFIDSFALLVSGGYAIRQGMSWMHRLAGGFLPNGFVARPAVNFLLFELEDAATADKLKLWGDEVGCIFPEDNCLRVHTSKRDICLSYDAISLETYYYKGKAAGVLMRWTAADAEESHSGVASFKYLGEDLRVGGDPERKAQWAQDIIRGWTEHPEQQVTESLDADGAAAVA